MSLSKDEINKVKCVFASEEKTLSRRVICEQIPVASTYSYFCEAGFSNYAATKTNYRNRLKAAPNLRVHLFNIKPNTKII
jgi:hypothetical protein